VCGLDSTGLGQGQVAGCCECGDEPSGSCATELVILSLNIVSVIDYFETLVLKCRRNFTHLGDPLGRLVDQTVRRSLKDYLVCVESIRQECFVRWSRVHGSYFGHGAICSREEFPTLRSQFAHLVWQVHRHLVWCECTASVP
jgi:hypothetical protein